MRFVVAALVGAAFTVVGAAPAHAQEIVVQPGGSVQAALDRAQPGDTVRLAPGVYRESIRSVRGGAPNAPITLTGPGATLVSDKHVIDIDHPWITVTDLAVYGQPGIPWDAYPADPSLQEARAFKEAQQGRAVDSRLVYVGANTAGVHDVVLDRLILRGAGGECVRMRSNAANNRVQNSVIDWCGMFAKAKNEDPFHNGEGVYVGTSPKSTGQPMPGTDQSQRNWVTGNRIATWGSECFNVKEAATRNVFQGNSCTGSIETTNGSLVELRGPGNVATGNTYGATAGQVVKVKADPGFSAAGNQVDQPGAASAPGVPSAEPSIPASIAAPKPQPTQPQQRQRSGSKLGSRSGLPYDIGVFAHSPDRVARFEEAIGRPVDVWQVAPQREQGDDVMISETKRIVGEAPDGVGFDIAIPLVSTETARQVAAAVCVKDPDAYIRPGWEFNLKGSWDWTVDRIGPDAFKAGFVNAAKGVRAGCPTARLEWNPNTGQGGVQKAVADAWPGDQWVDVIGVDAYDWSNEDPMDGPGQLNDWAGFAKTKGLPLSLPEWGAHGVDGRGDNPAFVNDVLAWAGRNNVAMISYFDEPAAYIRNSVGDGQMPRVGAALKAGFADAATGRGVAPRSAPAPSRTQTAPATPAPAAPGAPAPQVGTPVPAEQAPGIGLPPIQAPPRSSVPSWLRPQAQDAGVPQYELQWGDNGLTLQREK